MPKIVISYRRLDSDAIAGRIRDRLANHYGENAIFMDIDSIPLGIDFRRHVQDALSHSDVVIAVIGPKWLGPHRSSRSRIKEDIDPVRIEIETALQKGIRVIPVLVNHATMPKPVDLPESLEQFAYHNAAEIDAGRDFHQHMDRLVRSMDEILGRASRQPIASATRSRKWFVIAVSIVLCAIIAATWPLRNEFGRLLQLAWHSPPRTDESNRPPAPATTLARLESGEYDIVAAGFAGICHITVSRDTIIGTSTWRCCPGKRTDPISGSMASVNISFTRDCTGQGVSGPCYQVFTGNLGDNAASGTFTHNGKPAGPWTIRKRP
jgi:hypothetical protein